MLLIILIIWQSIRFYKIAKESGLNPIFWSITPLLGYFTLAFIIGLFLGIFVPDILENRGWLILLELISAGVALAVLNAVLLKVADNKKSKKFDDNNDIIDQF